MCTVHLASLLLAVHEWWLLPQQLLLAAHVVSCGVVSGMHGDACRAILITARSWLIWLSDMQGLCTA